MTCNFCEGWVGEEKRFFMDKNLVYRVAHPECLETIQEAEALNWVKTSWELNEIENPVVGVCNF